MPPRQNKHVLNVLADVHFGYTRLAVIAQIHRRLAELCVFEQREFEDDLRHAGESLLGDETICIAPNFERAAQKADAIEAVTALVIAHILDRCENLKEDAYAPTKQLTVRRDACHARAGLKAGGDHNIISRV